VGSQLAEEAEPFAPSPNSTAGNPIVLQEKKTMASRITTRSRKSSKRANNCKSEVGFIADYLSSGLDRQEQAAFESHLKACSDCAAFLQTYKKTIELTRAFLLSARESHRPRRSFPRRASSRLIRS
jgi:anti-sigma factor RsiW